MMDPHAHAPIAAPPEFPIRAVTGSGWQLGYTHGVAVATQARAFLDDRLLRINALLMQPTSIERLRAELCEYFDVIARTWPAMAEEIEGFARGAHISREEAILMQVRREIVGYSRVPVSGDCTTFAHVSSENAVIGQTVDLNGDLESEGYVLDVAETGTDARRLVMLTFTGLSGYLGMNSHGLCIGINLVLGGEWRPGIPAYMALRYLLEHARTVSECAALLEQVPLASSRSFMLCDHQSAAYVEFANGEFAWRGGDSLVHTNHFMEEKFAERDQLNVFARNGSKRRMAACEQALRSLSSATDMDAYWRLLEAEPICIKSVGDIRREVTVARVLMQPRAGRFAIRRGSREDASEQVIFLGNAA